MSLTDVDKTSDNRGMPMLNTSDTLSLGAHKAHDTEGVAYRTEDSTNTARLIDKDDHISVYDEDGNERIVLGRLPDGTYGLVIAKEDEDVADAFS